MAQVAQPCGLVDGRSDVVAPIAKLHFTGVDTDTQSDGSQSCTLQLESTVHRIAGPSERNDKAVALTLLHRSHTLVYSHAVRDDVV